jgi:hypothetical protein
MQTRLWQEESNAPTAVFSFSHMGKDFKEGKDEIRNA